MQLLIHAKINKAMANLGRLAIYIAPFATSSKVRLYVFMQKYTKTLATLSVIFTQYDDLYLQELHPPHPCFICISILIPFKKFSYVL